MLVLLVLVLLVLVLRKRLWVPRTPREPKPGAAMARRSTQMARNRQL